MPDGVAKAYSKPINNIFSGFFEGPQNDSDDIDTILKPRMQIVRKESQLC